MAKFRKNYRKYSHSARRVAMGYRSYKRLRTANASASMDSNPLTSQYDYKTDYRKRRLSRRRRYQSSRRRRWRKKIVNIVREANVGTTHVLRRSLYTLTTSPDQANAISYGLYGQNGVGGDTFNSTNDVRELFREIGEADWEEADDPVSQSVNRKLNFMHGTMEMTVRNVGEYDAIIEAYYIRGRRVVREGNLGSPANIYFEGFNKAALARNPDLDPSEPSFDQKLSVASIGSTPFQSPMFVKNYNIYKRVKFTIPPGKEISFVINDPRPRTFWMDTAKNRSTDRTFHGVLFQQYGLPYVEDTVTSLARPTTVTYLSVRRYRLKLMENALPSTAYDVSGS
ncbi:capsid protein [Apis mellifera virus-2]|nr:capsid protein [Apis mellifera virus-2]